MSAFIWDLDGTLIDSYEVIVSAAMSAAAEAGIADTKEEILRTVKRHSLSVYLHDAEKRSGVPYEQLAVRYREITHTMDDRIALIPGAESTVRKLAARGDTHYIFTHRGKSTGPILERLGILRCFREVVTAEQGFRPKPSGEGVGYLVRKYGLNPEKTWYTGDRALDVLCAKDAGVQAALFLPPGSYAEPTGREDLIIEKLDELYERTEL